MRKRIPLHLGDVLAGLLIILFLGSVGVVARIVAIDTADKAKCASNLHQIGLAIILYQNDNQQSYPYTVRETADNPKPVWGTPYEANKELGPQADANAYKGGKTAPAPNDVTAAFYQLLVNEQITSAVYICPATSQEAWDFGGGASSALNWTNWQGNDGLADHLSYSFQNVYASKDAIAAGFQMKNPDATFAVASDMNPGGDAVTSVTIQSTEEKMRLANSINHDQDGQNVLYGDGHVEFQSTPFCGTQHDNIFTAAGPEIDEKSRGTATIVASPVSNTDSILLPTSADILVVDNTPPLPVTPADVAKLKQQIKGTYATSIVGSPAMLTFDDDTFFVTAGSRKISYGYEITAAAGSRIMMKFTTPDSHFTGEIDTRKGGLRVHLDKQSALNKVWRRAGD